MSISSMNYVEFVICKDTKPQDEAICTNWKQSEFQSLCNHAISKTNLKPFVKNCKVYVKDTMHMESDTELRVYNKNPLEYKIISRNTIMLKYDKAKLPIHVFPSTFNINDVYLSETLTIRLHNRVFLNFEVQFREIGGKQENNYVRRIYINYNCEDNVDNKYIFEKICYAFNLLGKQAPTFELFHEICKSS